ncbi:hypothetical protein [Streptomyces sp. PmtA]|uniref:MmyB family transcriptional regulator n=1 Tax=unclassified Streptomyces TaxID=2593676 RepID=UPI0030150FC7
MPCPRTSAPVPPSLPESRRSRAVRHWKGVAADAAATLRMDAERHPDDRKLGELVGDLSVRSEHFRA